LRLEGSIDLNGKDASGEKSTRRIAQLRIEAMFPGRMSSLDKRWNIRNQWKKKGTTERNPERKKKA